MLSHLAHFNTEYCDRFRYQQEYRLHLILRYISMTNFGFVSLRLHTDCMHKPTGRTLLGYSGRIVTHPTTPHDGRTVPVRCYPVIP